MSVKILVGDVRKILATLEADSVDIVVTSPPYWGLRDYGVEGQMGSESSLGEHITAMVEVFSEVRRVMKPAAPLWLNYGDCYASAPNGRSAADTKAAGNDDRTFRDKPFSTVGGFLKPKDLCMLPFRVAIALQENGWWIRSRCMWGKPNGMPDSSGKYRPSVAHEEIFLLSKSGDLFYDAEAVKSPASEKTNSRVKMPDNWDTAPGSHHRNGREKGKTKTKQDEMSRRDVGFNDRWKNRPGVTPKSADEGTNIRAKGSFHASTTEVLETRYLRSYEPEVWHIPTAPYGEAHFATFPPALVERCLLAGLPKDRRCVVLDPFGGAGTTAMVADRMGQDAIMIELNPEYAEIARARIKADAGMFSDVA